MNKLLIVFTAFLGFTLLSLVSSADEPEKSEEEEQSYHLFNCTEDNKREHFEKMAQYMDHMIPILEMMAQQSESVGDEHKKHKSDLKSMVIHFKKYNETKELLRQKCEDSNTPIEECCKQIIELEKKFHNEMDHFNHEEHQEQSNQ